MKIEKDSGNNWEFKRLAHGHHRCLRTLILKNKSQIIDVNSNFLLINTVQLKSGSICFKNNDFLYKGPSEFQLVIFPFSILEWSIQGECEIQIDLFDGDIFNISRRGFVISGTENFKVESLGSEDFKLLENHTRFSKLFNQEETHHLNSAKKAKAIIDDNFRDSTTITALMEQAKLNPNSISKDFKKSFNLTPVAYRRRLRIFHSTMELLDSKDILSTSLDAGFNDLSRFYKNFRAISGLSPKKFQRK